MPKNNQKMNCIADPDSNCDDCDLNEKLICNFEKKFAIKFSIGNLTYRVLAVLVLVFVGFLMNLWWMSITYTIAVLITFIFIEPRLLCSHCPFYALEGKFLKCWALRGMPKLWKYRPGPHSNMEKKVMLIIGVYIDLFPYIGSIIGITWFVFNAIGNEIIGIGLILLTILFTCMVVYFSSILLGNACKRCPNFSCSMNKVSEDIRDSFLERNPLLKTAWKDFKKE